MITKPEKFKKIPKQIFFKKQQQHFFFDDAA